MQSLYSLPEWLFEAILLLDAHTPGSAGHVLRASGERRHVIAAYLAQCGADLTVAPATAALLQSAGHREILIKACGQPPAGLRGALRRSGPVPHDAEYYKVLQQLLAENGHKANVVRRLSTVDPDRLAVLNALPDDLQHANVVSAVTGLDDAQNLTLAIELMTRRGVDRATLCDALTRASTRAGLGNLILRRAYDIRFPPPPIAASTGYVPVACGKDLNRVALKYRNCARGYLVDAIAGEYAFGELTAGDQFVLLVFRRSQGIWCFDEVYRLRNRPVAQHMVALAESFARRHGVLQDAFHPGKPADLRAFQRVTRWAGGRLR